jgi:hypothetical protein
MSKCSARLDIARCRTKPRRPDTSRKIPPDPTNSRLLQFHVSTHKQGAAPAGVGSYGPCQTDAAVERREAQAPTSLGSRIPGGGPDGTPEVRGQVPSQRICQGSLASSQGVSQTPGASRRSITLASAGRGKRERADPAPENKEYGRRSVGFRTSQVKTRRGLVMSVMAKVGMSSRCSRAADECR